MAVCSCDKASLTTQHKESSHTSEHVNMKHLLGESLTFRIEGAIVTMPPPLLYSEVNRRVLFPDFTSLELKLDMLSWKCTFSGVWEAPTLGWELIPVTHHLVLSAVSLISFLNMTSQWWHKILGEGHGSVSLWSAHDPVGQSFMI